MGTWIELRCELKIEGAFGDRCFSDDNSGPMLMACDDRKSISYALKVLREDALETGWVKTRDGWVCPRCAIKAKHGGAA